MVATLKRGYPPAWKSNGLEAAPEGAKRRYEAHFVSKITDCDGLRLGAYPPGRRPLLAGGASESENSETDSSLDFAKECGYISTEQHKTLTATCSEIGRMLGGMIKKSEAFLIPGADL
ncbi:MAG TPA: four helix bundle protein [Chthoniobacterales bacterium]